MRSKCFPGHSPLPPQIRRERQRERERGRQSETETERETERERYSERHRERDRDRQRVCVFLTQSSLPGSSVCVTPWTVAHQAPLSKGFPRQENWSGWPFPPLGDLLDPGIGTTSPEFPSIGRGNLYHCTTWEAPKDNCWQLSRWFQWGVEQQADKVLSLLWGKTRFRINIEIRH